MVPLPRACSDLRGGLDCHPAVHQDRLGGTDNVWFYDLQADGSLDDKRTPFCRPRSRDLARASIERGRAREEQPARRAYAVGRRNGAEKKRPRTAQSFCVPKAEIAAMGGYDLSLNRYKEVEHEEQIHAAPADIIRELRALEDEIPAASPNLRRCWDDGVVNRGGGY